MDLNLLPEQIAEMVASLSERSQLEGLGRTLNGREFADLWPRASSVLLDNHDKLVALLVGLAPGAFSEALTLMSPEDIAALKSVALSEPLLHHLTLHSHALEQGYAALVTEVETLQQQITQLQPEYLEYSELQALLAALEAAQREIAWLVDAVGRALSLTWGCGRGELIDKLSALREQCLRCSRNVIGVARDGDTAPTGLYQQLEQCLNRVFGVPGVDNDALHDDDPAVEALAKLSIWYLDDFCDVGLLSSADPQPVGDALQRAEEQLTRRGLYTVGDVKRAGIASRSILTAFLGTEKQ